MSRAQDLRRPRVVYGTAKVRPDYAKFHKAYKRRRALSVWGWRLLAASLVGGALFLAVHS